MSVDLGELIEPLRREVSQPGAETSTFPDATDDSYFGHLQDAFWETVLDSVISGYTEADGIVTPLDVDDDDLGRDLQQLVVLYAGIRIIRNQLLAMNTLFRAKAGPVEYETQKSAQVLKGILDELKYRRDFVLARLAEVGDVDVYYIDAVLERDDGLSYGTHIWWE
jgi:hypothetical protein